MKLDTDIGRTPGVNKILNANKPNIYSLFPRGGKKNEKLRPDVRAWSIRLTTNWATKAVHDAARHANIVVETINYENNGLIRNYNKNEIIISYTKTLRPNVNTTTTTTNNNNKKKKYKTKIFLFRGFINIIIITFSNIIVVVIIISRWTKNRPTAAPLPPTYKRSANRGICPRSVVQFGLSAFVRMMS